MKICDSVYIFLSQTTNSKPEIEFKSFQQKFAFSILETSFGQITQNKETFNLEVESLD